MATLKEFLRDVRQEHDARIAGKYVAKEDLDFTADDVSDVFAGVTTGGTPQPAQEKLTPTFKITAIDEYHGTYEYDGDGEVFGYETAGSGIIIDRSEKTWRVYKYFNLEEHYETQDAPVIVVTNISAPGVPVTVTLYASEGERYKAAVASNA